MNERIHEILLVTRNADGSAHLAPMGLRQRDGLLLLAPFRPSRSLNNVLREGQASINSSDDVRIYAGCLSQHHDWPMMPCETIACARLQNALSHREIELVRIEDDSQRPKLFCQSLNEVNHRPFYGYNRAQAAVLELAVLVSRLHMLPPEKIQGEIAYLQIAIDKTAGTEEREAWDWLIQRVQAHHRAKECA